MAEDAQVLWRYHLSPPRGGEAIASLLVLVGLLGVGSMGWRYAAAGWGEVGNPWWNPLMLAVWVLLAPAVLGLLVMRQMDKETVVYADGRLRVRLRRRVEELDLAAFDRVTVKRKVTTTPVPAAPVSRHARSATLVVNVWSAGTPRAVRTAVPAQGGNEAALRKAIREARDRTVLDSS